MIGTTIPFILHKCFRSLEKSRYFFKFSIDFSFTLQLAVRVTSTIWRSFLSSCSAMEFTNLLLHREVCNSQEDCPKEDFGRFWKVSLKKHQTYFGVGAVEPRLFRLSGRFLVSKSSRKLVRGYSSQKNKVEETGSNQCIYFLSQCILIEYM